MEIAAVCRTCGTEFRPTARRREYCQKLCNPRYGWPCSICGVVRLVGNNVRVQNPDKPYTCHPCRRGRPGYHAQQSPVELPERPCETCGEPYKPRRRDSRYCSSDCHSRRCRGLDTAPRACEVCGTQYRPSYDKQRACGRVCGSKLNGYTNYLREAPKASGVTWRTCRTCERPYTTRGRKRCHCDAPRSRVFITDCRTCGQVFCSAITVTTCSSDCARRKRRRDRREAKYIRRGRERQSAKHVDRLAILDRDSYRCQLCGRALKMTESVPHPLAPTLDHIVPLAKGGRHEPENVQAAHFRCNSLKGARGGGEQLLLIG
jgi:5-methylcytosine-specific restriction endonuclease McrA